MASSGLVKYLVGAAGALRLRKKLAIARSKGDEPRRATLATLLGRAKTRRAPRLMDADSAISTSIG